MSRDLADLSSGHLPALASPGLRSIGALAYPGRVSLAACWWLQLTSGCRRPPLATLQGGWRAAQSRVSASVLPWALLNCCRAAVRWINKRGSASASHLPTLIPCTLVQQPPPPFPLLPAAFPPLAPDLSWLRSAEGKEGKTPLNLRLTIAPWSRSVGSNSWLCTARRSCRICPSSC